MAGVMGVGSGIDIGSIVKALVDAEKAPKTLQLNRLEAATTERFSGLGSLKSALSNFQSAVKSLNQTSLFEARTATSSDSARLTASATKDALVGSYQVKINTLASASKVASREIASGTTAQFNTGKLEVKLGGTSVASVTVADGATLSQIRDSINTQSQSKGVTANLITDPSDNSTRLVLSSTKTGANQHVTIDVTNLTGGAYAPLGGGKVELDQLAISNSVAAFSDASPNAGFITAPGNASLEIDGVAITSTENAVTGAIAGVTLSLKGVTEVGKPVTVDVGVDKAGVKSSLQKFVDAYNKLMSTSAQLTSVVQVGEGKEPVTGPLVGDATVRGLVSGIRNELVKLTGEGGVRALADLGITTQKDGTLKLDDSKLTTALNNNFDKVASYLTGETGLMGRLDKSVDNFSKTGGVLDQRIKGLQTTLSSIDKQREALDLRIAKVQERLVAQYTAMDQLVGRLQKTSESLAGQLASLPGFVKKDS